MRRPHWSIWDHLGLSGRTSASQGRRLTEMVVLGGGRRAAPRVLFGTTINIPSKIIHTPLMKEKTVCMQQQPKAKKY